ncbi:MAG TPA: hypothetical protein VNU68_25540 [Verrucomicrobiae bacterium]|jgi:hypothetical protein|nr:hypothetical protein [Verrucomicrobiae bacterium]
MQNALTHQLTAALRAANGPPREVKLSDSLMSSDPGLSEAAVADLQVVNSGCQVQMQIAQGVIPPAARSS